MARLRTIKPDFWDDETLAHTSRDARLLFIGLWNFSDDFGVVRGQPAWLKSKILPYEDIQSTEILEWLKELEAPPGRWIVPFMANGETFYWIRSFLKHQRIDKPSKLSRNPEPPATILDGLAEPSPSIPRALPEGSGLYSKGGGEVKEGNSIGGKPPADTSESEPVS